MKKREVGPKHLVIPDAQICPGDDLSHVKWAARYAASKLPETIACMGDWFDLPSLSSYDEGKLASHGRRYEDDIEAGNEGLRLFDRELRKYAPRSYAPKKFVVLGNHENRVNIAVDCNPKLEGTLSTDDFEFKKHGWTVHKFLRPYVCDSVAYAHYFPIGPNGRVVNSRRGAPSARAQVQRLGMSCVAGHQQGLDYHLMYTPFATYRGVIAGSFYRRDFDYLTEQGSRHWRGLLMFNDVQTKTGEFSLMEIDMGFLERRYG